MGTPRHRAQAGSIRTGGFHVHVETGRGRGSLSTALAVPEQPIGALSEALERLHDPHGPADLDTRLGALAAEAPEGTAFLVALDEQVWVYPSRSVEVRRRTPDAEELLDDPQVIALGAGDSLELRERGGDALAGLFPAGEAPPPAVPAAENRIPSLFPVDEANDAPAPAFEPPEPEPDPIREESPERTARKLLVPGVILGAMGLALAIGIWRGGAAPRVPRADAMIAPGPGPDESSAATIEEHLPPAEVEQGARSWVFRADGPISSSPLLTGGRVVFGSRDSFLYSLDASTGEVVWSLDAGSGIGSSPCAADGVCFVGTYEGKLIAAGLDRGELRWEAETGERIVSSPCVVGDRVIVGSYDKAVHAFDRKTGEKRWATRTEGIVRASPVPVGRGAVVFGSGDGTLFCLETQNGTVRWRHKTTSAILAAGAYDPGEDLLVVGNQAGFAYGFRAETGELLWKSSVGAEVNGQPRFAEGLVLVGTGRGSLYALDTATGERRWTARGERGFDARPLVVGKMVLAPTFDGTLHVLDLINGTTREERKLDAEVFSSPAAGKEFVYVATMGGSLHAFPLP